MTAKALRSMIHESERAAQTANEITCERERELAAEACVALWNVVDVGHPRSLARLVSCARRLASINFQRWASLLIALDKIFHKTVDSAAQIA